MEYNYFRDVNFFTIALCVHLEQWWMTQTFIFQFLNYSLANGIA